MSWQTEMTTMLRYIIGDYGVVQKYVDDDLQSLLSVAGRYVDQDMDLSYVYSIDITVPSISPDPTDVDDDTFINLTVLKAACLTDEWSLREKAIVDGIAAVCGPAKMAIKSNSGIFGVLIEHGPCAAYERTKFESAMGNVNNIRAILSPFVSNEFIPY